jgi:ornithine cyclodeaminase/alanine dehydrogenase-like protein (mu-crystallin family)
MNVPAPVLMLDNATTAELLTLDECITAVENAFAAHARKRALKPGLLHVDGEGGEFHIKVGGLRGESGARTYFGAKINGGFFQNRATHGLPNIIGIIVLSDGTTGVPRAIMESGVVTRLRTGAATAVAAKYLARPDSETALICGAGLQAQIQLRSLARVLPLKRFYLYHYRDASELARQLSDELQLEGHYTPDLAKHARTADVIVTCTPAKQAFLMQSHVVPGTFIAGVGADSPDKQELEAQLVASSIVVCDLVEQCSHVGELHHALAQGLAGQTDIRELGKVIIGEQPGRSSATETIVFDSTGTALQDVAAAAAVYERAVQLKRGQQVALWK